MNMVSEFRVTLLKNVASPKLVIKLQRTFFDVVKALQLADQLKPNCNRCVLRIDCLIKPECSRLFVHRVVPDGNIMRVM